MTAYFFLPSRPKFIYSPYTVHRVHLPGFVLFFLVSPLHTATAGHKVSKMKCSSVHYSFILKFQKLNMKPQWHYTHYRGPVLTKLLILSLTLAILGKGYHDVGCGEGFHILLYPSSRGPTLGVPPLNVNGSYFGDTSAHQKK